MIENSDKTSVLFVCMGNICRSPTAEGVFRKLVADAGLADSIASDSAGTHAFHSGSAPDRRAQAAAERRGFELSDIRSRAITADDFERYDYILAMDLDNLEVCSSLAGFQGKSKFMTTFAAWRFSPAPPDSDDRKTRQSASSLKRLICERRCFCGILPVCSA